MNPLLAALAVYGGRQHHRPALQGDDARLSYGELWRAVAQTAENLGGHTLGLWLDNGPAWVVLDLAAQLAGMSVAPIPGFFAAGQLVHLLALAGVDCVAVSDPARAQRLGGFRAAGRMRIAGEDVALFRRAAPPRDGLRGMKLSFTSGTTATPKGVCLAHEQVATVAESLRAAVAIAPEDTGLALLPLATLLENTAVAATLLAGGCVALPTPATTGVAMDGVDPARLARAIERYAPSGLVLVPALLRALLHHAEAGWRPPASLRFAAVGGAPLAAETIAQARAAGLPVYEGYGLTEACSVVCLNQPGADRIGSAGRPLPHARVRITDDGEIEVGGVLLDRFVGEPAWASDWYRTGDLGWIDDDGYVHVAGRRDHVIVTAFGRNVAPEWPECALLAQPAVRQAVVFGHGRRALVALIAASPGCEQEIPHAVREANGRLPAYARIARHHVLERPLSHSRGELTTNGRARRETIARHFAATLAALDAEESHGVLP